MGEGLGRLGRGGPSAAARRAAALALMLLTACSDIVVGHYDGSGTSAADPSPSTSAETEAIADTETVFVPPGCFADDFEDGVLDPDMWNTWAEENSMVLESTGRLRLTPPSYGLYDTGIVGSFRYVFPFHDGWVRMQLGDPPEPARAVALFLIVGTSAQNVAINLGGGAVRATTSVGEVIMFEESHGKDPYPAWIGIRAESGMVHFEFSDDGVVWNTLTSAPAPAVLDEAGALVMAQSFGDDPTQAEVSVEHIEVCIQ